MHGGGERCSQDSDWEDNIKMDIWEIEINRTEFGWPRTGSSGGLL
jgi:hypothetical protein